MAKTKVHGEYLDPSVISAQTEVTAVGSDHMLIFDATDNALKKALLSDLIETVGSTPTFTGLTVNSSEVLFDNTGGDFTLKLNTNAVSDKNEIIMGDTGTPLAKFGVGGTANDIITGSDGQDFNIGTAGGGRAINFSTDNFASVEMKFDGGKLGIGETTPLGKLHVKEGDSGQGSINSNFDQLVLEDDAHSGMTILSGTSSDGGIYFGDSGGNNMGQFKYKHGTNSFTFATNNGSESLIIDSSGMLLVNTQSSWGGETTPHIESRGDVAGDYTGLIVSNTNDAAGDSVSVNFGLARDGGLVFGNAGKITVGKEQDWTSTPSTVDGFMSFSTMQNESLTERVRITSSGGLEVGDGTNYGYLKVISNNAVTGYFDRRNGSGTILQFRLDDSTIGSLNIQSSTLQIGTGNTQLAFSDADDAFFVKNEAGANRDGSHDLGKSGARFHNLYLSGGAYLGGTGSANHLDDYEEGTWTPVLNDSGAAITNTAGTTYNWYVKVGRVVHVSAHIIFSAADNSGNAIRITGLPFTTSSSVAVAGSMISRFAGTTGTFAPYITGSALYFYLQTPSTTWRQIAYNDVGAMSMHMSISYQTT